MNLLMFRPRPPPFQIKGKLQGCSFFRGYQLIEEMSLDLRLWPVYVNNKSSFVLMISPIRIGGYNFASPEFKRVSPRTDCLDQPGSVHKRDDWAHYLKYWVVCPIEVPSASCVQVFHWISDINSNPPSQLLLPVSNRFPQFKWLFWFSMIHVLKSSYWV